MQLPVLDIDPAGGRHIDGALKLTGRRIDIQKAVEVVSKTVGSFTLEVIKCSD